MAICTGCGVVIAPFYGSEQGEKRSGFADAFIQRVRRCEYPQFIWDLLPINEKPEDSIMRLDHMVSVGRNQDSVEITEFCMTEDALMILDEWLEWLIKGNLPIDSFFGEAREDLLKTP